MADGTNTAKVQKDRSPSFPFIPLQMAVERLSAFEETFKRHPAPASKAGIAWKMKPDSSQAGQTLAALKAFGLLEYQGVSASRTASLTDEGRNLLRAQQESVKADILKRSAVKPRVIEKYWQAWGPDRPIDAICLDELVLHGGFTEAAARLFLRVYDATIGYAGLRDSDSGSDEPKTDEAPEVHHLEAQSIATAPPQVATPILGPRPGAGFEVEWMRNQLGKGTVIRIIASGIMGPKEIGSLIKLLEAQKAVLDDDDPDDI